MIVRSPSRGPWPPKGFESEEIRPDEAVAETEPRPNGTWTLKLKMSPLAVVGVSYLLFVECAVGDGRVIDAESFSYTPKPIALKVVER